jgi:hypothetical protein
MKTTVLLEQIAQILGLTDPFVTSLLMQSSCLPEIIHSLRS